MAVAAATVGMHDRVMLILAAMFKIEPPWWSSCSTSWDGTSERLAADLHIHAKSSNLLPPNRALQDAGQLAIFKAAPAKSSHSNVMKQHRSSTWEVLVIRRRFQFGFHFGNPQMLDVIIPPVALRPDLCQRIINLDFGIPYANKTSTATGEDENQTMESEGQDRIRGAAFGAPRTGCNGMGGGEGREWGRGIKEE
jgi:hypothetical protein